jgi:hypothetical protein
MKKTQKSKIMAHKGQEKGEGFLVRFFSSIAFLLLALAALADLGALMIHKIFVFKRKTA